MLSVVEIGFGALVAAITITAGIRKGSRRVPKYAPHDPKSKASPLEPTLRRAFFHATKWTLGGHLLLMAVLIILAAIGLFEGNHAATLIAVIASTYALYRIASWSTVMVCLGDRSISAPDATITPNQS